MLLKRRTFLQGCCSAIAAMSGSQLGNLAFAAPGSQSRSGARAAGPRDTLVTIFLRGGMDALSLLAPHGDSNYFAARPRTRLLTAQALDIDGYFGLHPSASKLKALYDAQHLALIPACGFPDSNRSHFEAQDMIDAGVSGGKGLTQGGWLGRHLAASPPASASVFQAVSIGSGVGPSLAGAPESLAMDSAANYTLNTDGVNNSTRTALRAMYATHPDLSDMALGTLDAVDLLEGNPAGDYTPRNGAVYPGGEFGDDLKSLAQMLRLDIGLDSATIDFGGWDTHENQCNSGNAASGYLADRFKQVSDGLHAFWTDLLEYHGRLTVVVVSEFGRRLRENDNTGTDHGHGGLMMVLSSSIRQKRIWGTWPGLATDQLFERNDVQSTTDYRQVLAELLMARRGLTSAASVFPGYVYPKPVGFFLSGTSAVDDWMCL